MARKDVPHWEHPDDIALIRSTLKIDQEFNDVSYSRIDLTVRRSRQCVDADKQYPVRETVGFEESDDDEY